MAVEPGQAQVEHQRVMVVLLQRPVGQAAVIHPLDLDAGVLQRLAQSGAQGMFVFSQQNAHRRMLEMMEAACHAAFPGMG